MTATARRIHARARLDVIDPDIVYGASDTSGAASYSNAEQLTDPETESARIVTLEANHWPLDGSFRLADEPMENKAGFVSAALSGADCAVSGVYAAINMTGLDVLAFTTVFFSEQPEDGYAVDFSIGVYSGATLVYAKNITDNASVSVPFSGFTAYNVTRIVVTPTRWSRQYTFPRVIAINPGLHKKWEGSGIYSVETYKEIDFSMITVPYGTATIEINNAARDFDPRNKDGIFTMIEARQAIPIEYGVELPDGAVEWFSAGVFYQQNLGWETERGGLLMKFSLVDILGLLRDRKYRPPLILPATLYGWVASIAGQLGTNFEKLYFVDDALADYPLTATQANVQSVTCGELLRLACMAAGAVCYADAQTGKLMVTPVPPASGTSLTLDNLADYPKQKANLDIAFITFQLTDGDGNSTQFVINGNSTSANTTLSVSNFFITDQTAAQIVARRIIGNYGGQSFESVGRGDLRSELGDLDSIEVYPGSVVGGRRNKQQIKLSNNGVVRDVVSGHVQPTGEDIYKNTIVITTDGEWAAPDGVTRIRVTVIGGGQGGAGGGTGYDDWDPFNQQTAGKAGQGGKSGRVWTGAFAINAGQLFDVHIGQGGAGGEASHYGAQTNDGAYGTPSLFGAYTSENGTEYNGMIDITTGAVYAENGVAGESPCNAVTPGIPGTDGTGDGGSGGGGGQKMLCHLTNGNFGHLIVDKYAVPGGVGGNGGVGCVIVSYDL
jgi:hypothetical protein